MCHLDATMTKQGLDELGVEELDLVFLENIDNLISPAGYDTGAMKNVAILSVPEGDDKPLKYPKIFGKVEVLIVSKIDASEHFDFRMDLLEERVRKLNKDIIIFPISAKTGEGVEKWVNWIRKELNKRSWYLFGCGACTLKCEFDAIKLEKVYDVKGYEIEKLQKVVIKKALTRKVKIFTKKLTFLQKVSKG